MNHGGEKREIDSERETGKAETRNINNNKKTEIMEDDFLVSFRNINSNLRKRFLRRPNVTEAVESYGTLSKLQSDRGFFELSAVCLLASSHLEQAVNLTSGNINKTDEQSFFIEAGRRYSKCEKDWTNAAELSVVTCFQAAVNHSQDPASSFLAAVEAGKISLQNDDTRSAVEFFSKALGLAKDDGTQTLAVKMLINAFLKEESYIEAFETVNRVTVQDVSLKVTRFLLALLLKRLGIVKGNSDLSQSCEMVFASNVTVAPEEFCKALNMLLTSSDDPELNFSVNIWKYLSVEQSQILLLMIDA